VYQVKIYVNYLSSISKRNIEEPWIRWMCWILKCELGQWPNIDPTYFWQPYFSHFTSFFSNINEYECAKSRFEKPFALERQKDNVLKFELIWEFKLFKGKTWRSLNQWLLIGLFCYNSMWVLTRTQLFFLIPYCFSYLLNM
jgi:hypothetical protein